MGFEQMTEDQHIDQITSIIRRMEDAAFKRGYEKGQADKAAEIQKVLNTTHPLVPRGNESASETGAETVTVVARDLDRPASERKRAPKGLVPKFVKKVLTQKPGLTPKDIQAEASDEYERMIKAASIRSELRKDEYRSEDGKWFLAQSNQDEAEGRSLQDFPSASNSSTGGSEDAAALADDSLI